MKIGSSLAGQTTEPEDTNNYKNLIAEIENRISQLIAAAIFFNNYTGELFDIYKQNKHRVSAYKLLVCIHNNLYFGYVLRILKTLFESGHKPKEQSFESWQRIRLQSQQNEIQEFDLIKEDYKRSPLPKFRDKLEAHKDVNNAGDTVANFLNPVKREHIKQAGELLEALKNYVCKYFVEYDFYSFSTLYKPSLDIFIKFVSELGN